MMHPTRLAIFAASLFACTACTSAPTEPDPVTGSGPGPEPTPIVPSKGPAGAPSRESDKLGAAEPVAAPCVGEPGSLYAIAPTRLGRTEPFPLCKLKRRVLLIVNVASLCGSTPQYAPMQALHTKYEKRGFTVLGFPSKTFAQELESDAEVTEFCTTQYNITFPMFTIGNVNPPDQQPVYTWLKAQPGQSADVGWNFEKFVVSRDGKVAARFPTAVEPDAPEVIAAIEAELAKP
jgi:glutathione peroxidase